MMSTVDEAIRLIRSRLAELEAERNNLQSALSSLNGRRPGPTSRGRGRLTRPRKRASRGQRREQFLSAVRDNPGEKIAVLAKSIGVAPQQLYPIARNLRKEGAIAKLDGGFTLTARPASTEPKRGAARASSR